eukprot:1010143-Prymnesium_polylepis.1
MQPELTRLHSHLSRCVCSRRKSDKKAVAKGHSEGIRRTGSSTGFKDRTDSSVIFTYVSLSTGSELTP